MKGTFAKTLTCCIFMLLLVGLLPSRVRAWGREGHQIVAGIAEKFLKANSPQTLVRAQKLLGGNSLMSVATFADDVRTKRQYTKNWHFVDIPLGENGYVTSRDCKTTNKGDCAIQALVRFGAVLADASEDDCIRAEALKFIVHIVGDMHQPLHNVDDDDAGGNGKAVKFFELKGFDDNPPNLHGVWDEGIINHSKMTVQQFIDSLTPADPGNVSLSSVVWAQESHGLAQEAYARLPPPDANDVYILDNDSKYFDDGLPVVKTQLAKGVVRLAKVLIKALG